MKIGVMGYYGFGNAGDEIILDTLRRFLSPHRVLAFQTAFPPTEEAIERLNAFDFLILGGVGLLYGKPPSPFDTFDQWMHNLKTPIGILGLGIEILEPPYVPTIQKLVDSAKFFVVRDAESKRLIGHPRVQVAPDLTFFRPQRVTDNQKSIKESIVCGVNLRPSGRRISEWVGAVSDLPCSKRTVPFSVHPAFDDRVPLSTVDLACPDQFSIRAYEYLDIMIGTAFHSIVFAIQNGVPAVAINYHPKVRRLMEEIGLGAYVLERYEWDQLRGRYDRALMNRNRIREKMLDHTALAHQELVQLQSDILHNIDALEPINHYITVPISSEPKVSIIVQCCNVSDSAVTKTIQSCLAQTYHNLEILLIIDAQIPNNVAEVYQDDDRVQLVHLTNNSTDWVIAAQALASGDYITWLQAGDWYADDALALLVRLLQQKTGMDLIYADYFLTNNGNIERKIETSSSNTLEVPPSYGPCFLARRNKALEVRYIQANTDLMTKSIESLQGRVLHIPHALLFRSASESEIYLYRSAIAYGYGQIEKAEKHLFRAAELDPDLIDSPQAKEKLFQFFWNTPFNIVLESDRLTYIKTVSTNLPTGTHDLRTFRNFFIARASIAEAFILREQGQLRKIRRLLLRGIWYDPNWLLNRGVLSLFAESMFSRSILQVYRQSKEHMKEILN